MGAPIPACVLPPSGPAASGQPRPSMANGAWRGNLSQTAIDRKPLQTDKLTGRAFDDEVYAVVAQIPAGKIVSYKQIARLIGMPDHARRVGRAMASAPAELPCHRVVNSAGRTAPGWPQQRELLDHTLLRRGLVALLSQYEDLRVVGEAAKPQTLSFKKQMSLLDVMIAVGGRGPPRSFSTASCAGRMSEPPLATSASSKGSPACLSTSHGRRLQEE